MPGYAYPGLGTFSGQQAEAIRMLWDAIHTLREGAKTLEVLTPTAAAQSYSPSVMRTELSGHGNYPLNVEGLRGVLADAQRVSMTVIPSTSTLPSGAGLLLYIAYEMVSWRGNLYYLDPSTNPPQWAQVAVGVTITYGTLSPDTKPTYDAVDAGKLFHSTDFNRTYLWTGTVWVDGPQAPARYQFGLFDTAPGAGWALCNGNATTRSTSSGGTTAYTPTDLVTNGDFLRPWPTAGVSGGGLTHAHAVDPPDTTSGGPSDVVTVSTTAAVVDVATDVHTHNVNIASFSSGTGSSIPLFYGALPYIRL